MATNKPQVKAYIENTVYEKFKVIAEKEHRSTSNYIEMLIIKEIENYETTNGAIATNKTINMNDNNGTINM